MASAGSERTADELGRAFPGIRVIVADGAHPVTEVDARPALVVATRGAEPVASGGYRAVILLDGDRMLLADDLRIGESCLRWWSNAAALAAPGAPVHLVGVAGPVARAFATWTQPAYARAELADRSPLRMPPTVRVAALEGDARGVATALDALREAVPALDADAVLGPIDRDGTVRALVRFDYALGARVTESLRASIVSQALKSRNTKGRPARPRNTLRVRVDVPDLDL
jgi:primosomal protein N' (replication factor Y)